MTYIYTARFESVRMQDAMRGRTDDGKRLTRWTFETLLEMILKIEEGVWGRRGRSRLRCRGGEGEARSDFRNWPPRSSEKQKAETCMSMNGKRVSL